MTPFTLRQPSHVHADDVWDEDSAYMEMLANEGARLREKSARLGAGEDDEDSDDESDIDEELGYISPLDNVDPYVSFKQALTGMCLRLVSNLVLTTLSATAFQMKNPSAYQVATTSLNTEQQTMLMEVMRVAEEKSKSG